jgi:hypothetical protein
MNIYACQKEIGQKTTSIKGLSTQKCQESCLDVLLKFAQKCQELEVGGDAFMTGSTEPQL